ncbi:septal ring lytic transglycosylase RlpA family protein [Thioalkalicoccus limnaeus]|uniref:Endolytic peptidoglycan transglycosylase RlpA n=1 Tax=Thioalkalicoccus limnaeus TaxID=120681 RepID=A0ABV4BCP9_9GAMM
MRTKAKRSEGSIGWGRLLFAVALVALLSGCVTTGDPRLVEDSGANATLVEPERDERVARDRDAEPPATATPQIAGSYVVFGKRYVTWDSSEGHVERGLASWYGRKFHGRRTSNGERYDMYELTAAHRSLPLPTYAEVTNLNNGRSVLVRINDRGPFVGDRVIDLSYAAARELGMVQAGVAKVELRAVDPPRRQVQDEQFLIAERATPSNAVEATDAVALEGQVLAQPASSTVASVSDPAVASLAASDSRDDSAAGSIGGVSSGRLYVQAGTLGSRASAEQLRRRLLDHLTEQVQVRISADAEIAGYALQIGPLASAAEAEGVEKQLVAMGVTQTQTRVE